MSERAIEWRKSLDAGANEQKNAENPWVLSSTRQWMAQSLWMLTGTLRINPEYISSYK